MTVVFRIRTSAGQELSFASREMFEDFVRSGDLSPDDLVYDGETGSWAPARTHPVVLDVQYAVDAETDAPSPTSGEAVPEVSSSDVDEQADDVAPSATDGRTGLEFDLVLREELSPEDEQRVFLEQLEAERQDEVGSEPSLRESLTGFTADTLAPRDEPRRRPPERARAGASPGARPARSAREPAASRTTPARSGGLGRVLLLLVALGLIVGGGYAGYTSWVVESGPNRPEREAPQGTTPEADLSESAAGPVEPEPEPEPEAVLEAVIPDTPAAVRERAQERYLAATQAELRTLQPIPDVWPEGPYVTVPSDHPEVVDVWQDYRATIQSVRGADADRYLTALEAALDDAALSGEGRRTRRETALGDFAASEPLRAAHFDRVEALATAAIQSHNALLEAEGLILFDATGSTGRPSGIAEGTSGRNAEAQLLLDQVVELLEGALDAGGEGPGSGANVREWVWDGFLDAMTR